MKTTVLLAASVLGQTFGFCGAAFATYGLLRYVAALRSRRILRAWIGLGAGGYLQSKITQATAIVSVRQIAQLDSPMGREMVALVQEGDFPEEAKQALLWSLKPDRQSKPRIRPMDSPFSQASVREAESAVDSSEPTGFSSDSQWSPFPTEDFGASGVKEARRIRERPTAPGDGKEQQHVAGDGWASADGDSAVDKTDLGSGTDSFEQDIFGVKEVEDIQQSNSEPPRKSRHRERREDRRRRHLEADTQPMPDDNLEGYFDKRWDGKGN